MYVLTRTAYKAIKIGITAQRFSHKKLFGYYSQGARIFACFEFATQSIQRRDGLHHRMMYHETIRLKTSLFCDSFKGPPLNPDLLLIQKPCDDFWPISTKNWYDLISTAHGSRRAAFRVLHFAHRQRVNQRCCNTCSFSCQTPRAANPQVLKSQN